MKYKPRYSGPNRSGICICGCSWDDHHLGMVMNRDYVEQTGEVYIPDECDAFGFNEVGGMKYNTEKEAWEDHCHGYRDTKDTSAFSKGYKHRNGRPVSDACGDGEHAKCTQDLTKCNCTVRSGHTTMHAYM
jgi:hypothetical protein